MTPLHALNETLCDGLVLSGDRRRLSIPQDHIIHHRERRHQFGPRALRQQRLGRVGHLYHQEPAGRDVLAESQDVFSQQRIEGAGDPLATLVLGTPQGLLVRDDFRASVQILPAAQELARGRSLVYQQGEGLPDHAQNRFLTGAAQYGSELPR
jgi:hypothetical protein